MTLVIPMVTWQDAREEWVVDIYSRLLQDRIIFLGTPIDEQIANVVVAELLHLESEQSDRDIAIYVNSPGGSVYAGLAIYDTMQFVRPDVQTMCVGMAMGMGALIVLRRHEREAGRPPARQDLAQPGLRRVRGGGERHRDPGA
jgi:ATP-dependent Clp protease protease subunit